MADSGRKAGQDPDDRDALLRELYHRTQNTLQIIASFARLRAVTTDAQDLAIELERSDPGLAVHIAFRRSGEKSV